MTDCHDKLNHTVWSASALQIASLAHGVVIGQNAIAIETKADQALTFDLHELTLKVKHAEETKKIDEDYGLGVRTDSCSFL